MYILVDEDNIEKGVTELPEGATFYDWKYYAIGNMFVSSCYNCWKQTHVNLQYDWYCLKCARKAKPEADIVYCPDCKRLHRKLDACNTLKDIQSVEEETCSFWQSVRIDTACKSFHAKWECVNSDKVNSIWQFQSERELPADIKEDLNRFYHWRRKFNHYYYRGDYNIEWDVSYLDVRKFRDILSRLRDIKLCIDDVCRWYKVSPYRNYSLVWITSDWLLERAKYDLMWKEKHWVERPNNFLQSIGKEINNKDTCMSLHYRLSSDLEHKMLAFKSNKLFGSCQKSENYDSYAAWAYDAVTNGCNLPILIYKGWEDKPMWRITCRVMYDKDWKEYLLLERLYHNGTLGDCDVRGKMYAKIAHDLKCKWYNVIASNYSAHDSSTYSYLARYWLSSNTIVEDLVQPLRQTPNGYWYYCDWGTEVLHNDIDWIDWSTDYLDKAYLV